MFSYSSNRNREILMFSVQLICRDSDRMQSSIGTLIAFQFTTIGHFMCLEQFLMEQHRIFFALSHHQHRSQLQAMLIFYDITTRGTLCVRMLPIIYVPKLKLCNYVCKRYGHKSYDVIKSPSSFLSRICEGKNDR